ncbi:MAG: hypothetical protein WC476_11740 [Phycisphaerae bacterium]
MKIYKIRAWTNKRIKRGRSKGSIEHTFSDEVIVINNLASAKRKYVEMLNKIKYEQQYADNGHCELFIPHKFEDGTLAYWPNNDKYIKKYNSEEN